ncbi:MAG: exodeoxyribonuclease VII small subunit [Ignavibacteriae bacterium]|jgi:exodeoxyribonuclease VII small subunit|nr:exodeoxyribonuclease VII small subunit [Ignavibacteriota bacterium]
MAKKNETSFEDQIKRLEYIVSVLDQGNASLNDMMSLYEEGMTLIVSCKKTLDEAEQKLTVLGAL